MTSRSQEELIPIKVTIPLWLHTQLVKAVGPRAMSIVAEGNPSKTVTHTEDSRAIKQAEQEALQEAIEDWLAKEKSSKWG